MALSPIGRAALAVVSVLAALLAALALGRPASAFPPGICHGTSCTGSTTDSFAGVDLCVPGTTVYWEDSYIDASDVDPRLAKFAVSPAPPCTGSTLKLPTADPWPASNIDPDGKPAPKHEPGKAIFRFRWSVTVPKGSKPRGTMSVAWTLTWTKGGSGGGTTTSPHQQQTTTSAGPCPESGSLPARCRYDLEVQAVGPETFSGNRQHDVRFKVHVYNNGPAASPALAGHSSLTGEDSHLRVSVLALVKPFSSDKLGGYGVTIWRSRPGCKRGLGSRLCNVRALSPRGEESFVFDAHWDMREVRDYRNAVAAGKDVVLQFNASVVNAACQDEETNCKNNEAADEVPVGR